MGLKKNSHYNEILLVKKKKISSINEDVSENLFRSKRLWTRVFHFLETDKIDSFRNTEELRLLLSRLGNILKTIAQKPRKGSINSLRKEFRSGHLKRKE